VTSLAEIANGGQRVPTRLRTNRGNLVVQLTLLLLDSGLRRKALWVAGKILLQSREEFRIRFETEDFSLRPNRPGSMKRNISDVGVDTDKSVAWPKKGH
jgi:hypothetical protein